MSLIGIVFPFPLARTVIVRCIVCLYLMNYNSGFRWCVFAGIVSDNELSEIAPVLVSSDEWWVVLVLVFGGLYVVSAVCCPLLLALFVCICLLLCCGGGWLIYYGNKHPNKKEKEVIFTWWIDSIFFIHWQKPCYNDHPLAGVYDFQLRYIRCI
jgi:hypothetical protein